MKAFIMKQEHYCPKMEKNIVLERKITGGKSEDICLNRHECNCGEKCENRLLDRGIISAE